MLDRLHGLREPNERHPFLERSAKVKEAKGNACLLVPKLRLNALSPKMAMVQIDVDSACVYDEATPGLRAGNS
jgi:hypothetical protein